MGIRFCFELLDNFIGQFVSVFFPHAFLDTFIPTVPSEQVLKYVQHYTGAIEFLCNLRMGDPGLVCHRGHLLSLQEFPRFPDLVALLAIPPEDRYESAHEYLRKCTVDDLMLRVNPSRVKTYIEHVNAVGLLYKYWLENPVHVSNQWNTHGTVSYTEPTWSPEQRRVLDMVDSACSRSDANIAFNTLERALYVSGKPGAGKTEVLVACAIKAADKGLNVLVLCPTGSLVHTYKDRMPDTEHIVVETIHAGMCIYRQADSQVSYSA